MGDELAPAEDSINLTLHFSRPLKSFSARVNPVLLRVAVGTLLA